jgi:hypothetical protein
VHGVRLIATDQRATARDCACLVAQVGQYHLARRRLPGQRRPLSGPGAGQVPCAGVVLALDLTNDCGYALCLLCASGYGVTTR